MKLAINAIGGNLVVKALAAKISKHLLAQKFGHPSRVAVDGFCGAGKTTFANEFEECLKRSGRHVIRATTDDFQHPPSVRWQEGKDSPLGFYQHSVDTDALRDNLLIPLGPGGSLQYRVSVYDIHKMEPNLSDIRTAGPTSILLVDGLFLLRKELQQFWDFSIFVETSFETCIARAKCRNQEQLPDPASVEARYREKYVPGFQKYLERDGPMKWTDVFIENESDH